MKTLELNITNHLEELERIHQEVESMGEKWELPARMIFSINLVLEELITNVIFYAYQDTLIHQILIRFRLDGDNLKITIEDDGTAFDPLTVETPGDLDKSLEERKIGGLGIHLIKKMMDQVEYQREDDKNIISLTTKINK